MTGIFLSHVTKIEEMMRNPRANLVNFVSVVMRLRTSDDESAHDFLYNICAHALLLLRPKHEIYHV